MAKTRVTFVHAPNPVYAAVQNNGVIFMPVWAYTLAAHLGADDYDLALVDMRVSTMDSVTEADVFLFTGINQDYPTLVDVHGRLKARFPKARFILGGPITWSYDQAGDLEKLTFFDQVFIGDAEDVIAEIVRQAASGQEMEKVRRRKERFEIAKARPLYRQLLENTVNRYYGAVLEVSRGCPFLCEFCDIRVLPDNNRPHNKNSALIVEELDYLYSKNVRTFLLACDNFIGDPRWAEEVVDGILEWRTRTGATPVLYTWLTINLYKMPNLMRKMRMAGFDIVFIGVESFNSNSLLETAKVQNTAAGVVGAVQEIQSYGFSVIAGLIFGFDSDGADCFDVTLAGILESGLLSGDPSFLTALPGTPLYKRMSMAGRIREVRYGLGGHKYHTNVRYLQPRDKMIGNFLEFVKVMTDGEYQYKRLQAFFNNLQRGNYVPVRGGSYFDLGQAVRMVIRDPQAVRLALDRVRRFAANPRNLKYFFKGFLFVWKQRNIENRFAYLKFWLALWTTIIVKYQKVCADDFDIESVPDDFDIAKIIPDGYEDIGIADIPDAKVKAQRRETSKQLKALVSSSQNR